MGILQSASKIVFILITVALIIGLFLGKVDPKDFMVLASMVYVYYFNAKQPTSDQVTSTTTTTISPPLDTSVGKDVR